MYVVLKLYSWILYLQRKASDRQPKAALQIDSGEASMWAAQHWDWYWNRSRELLLAEKNNNNFRFITTIWIKIYINFIFLSKKNYSLYSHIRRARKEIFEVFKMILSNSVPLHTPFRADITVSKSNATICVDQYTGQVWIVC